MSREPPTLIDLIVIALSPALIIALVCSLTFFLVDLLYVGQYESRITYTMFFFVVGAVLIARISIEMGHGRAAIYGIALGLAVWVALRTFLKVDTGGPLAPFAPVIDLLIMAVVWWSAHKLTWDCTFIDERRESSSRGLLSAAGFEPAEDAVNRTDSDVIDDVEVEDDSRDGLIERWNRFRAAQRNKPHTPGLWVIYFSLAALPIFGLGQSLIPNDADDRRAYAFWLMLVYVGSGMGLLLTTSFLGLRRYLRQRNLQMPAKMTGTWLGLGGAMIGIFLLIATVLPRPYSETPIIEVAGFDSKKRDASDYAAFRDSPGEGEGRAGNQSRPGDGDAVSDQGEQAGHGEGEGDKGSGSRQGKQQSDGGDRQGDRRNQGDRESRSGSQSSRDDPQSAESRAGGQVEERDGGTDGEGGSSDSSLSSGLSKALEWLATIVKWVIFGLLVIVVLVLLFRNGLAWLANFMPWARRWLDAWKRFWENLFGRREGENAVSIEDEETAFVPVPFAAFSNPFHDGSAGRRSVEELLSYTFAALEAWAREQGVGRGENETALEFTGRLGDEVPGMDEASRRFGALYVRIAYANRTPPAQTQRILEEFWDRLTDVNAAPMSA